MSDLQSRIEFALRDAGFSNREAATLAKRAAAVPNRERVAKAIAIECEGPDVLTHKGDAQGRDFRWQDYLGTADAAIDAMGETP